LTFCFVFGQAKMKGQPGRKARYIVKQNSPSRKEQNLP